MSGAVEIFSTGVVNQSGESVKLEESCPGKVIGIYFSAHWCPPCRGFTPELVKFYNNHHEAKNFEIIFVSSDRDEASFKDYYGSMPWLALNFGDRDLKAKLCEKYGVRGIPSFVLIDADSGNVINGNARGNILDDSEAADFPWKE